MHESIKKKIKNNVAWVFVFDVAGSVSLAQFGHQLGGII